MCLYASCALRDFHSLKAACQCCLSTRYQTSACLGTRCRGGMTHVQQVLELRAAAPAGKPTSEAPHSISQAAAAVSVNADGRVSSGVLSWHTCGPHHQCWASICTHPGCIHIILIFFTGKDRLVQVCIHPPAGELPRAGRG